MPDVLKAPAPDPSAKDKQRTSLRPAQLGTPLPEVDPQATAEPFRPHPGWMRELLRSFAEQRRVRAVFAAPRRARGAPADTLAAAAVCRRLCARCHRRPAGRARAALAPSRRPLLTLPAGRQCSGQPAPPMHCSDPPQRTCGGACLCCRSSSSPICLGSCAVLTTEPLCAAGSSHSKCCQCCQCSSTPHQPESGRDGKSIVLTHVVTSWALR